MMHEHRTAGPVSIQVLGGLITIKTPQSSDDLSTDEVMVLDSGVAHSLTAKTDSTLLLTISLNSDHESPPD
jgi:quercetin dioxygenase-like cupin family protein